MAGCPACGGPLVTDRERGEVVCAQCGLVVAESAVDTEPEWRSFDKEKRVRTAPLKLVVKTDMAVKPEHGARWRMLAKFHRETLHGYERRLVKIGAELRRIRECAGLPQHVMEEAESLVKKYFEVVAGFPPEVVAVAVLWTAAKAAGVPRPLEDFLKCSRAEERRVRKAAWRLKEVMKLREPLEPALVIKIDPVEELLQEWPELEAFGTEWVRKWLDLRERLIEIAKVMRKYPWMVEVIRQRPMSILHPYMVNAYVAKDGSEVCLQLASKTFCARGGEVREVKLELKRARLEPYEDALREVYRPKGLFAFTTNAREYVEIL